MYFKSLKAKIILFGAIGIIVTSAISLTYTSINTYKESKKNIENYVIAETEKYALLVEGKFNVALEAARQFKNVLIGGKKNPFGYQISRDAVLSYARSMAKESPYFLGVDTEWEVDAFDNLNSEYAGKEYFPDEGSLGTYWVWSKGQLYGQKTKISNQQFEYYSLPKKTLKEQIIDPAAWDAGGEMIFSSSVSVPIVIDGVFKGITDVEISLAFIQNLMDEINLFDHKGKSAVISNNGTYAGYTGRPDLVSKKTDDSLKVISNFKSGETRFLKYVSGHLVVAIPFRAGNTDRSWFVETVVPEEVITGPIKMMIYQQLVIVLIFSAIAIVILALFSGVIANRILGDVIELGNVSTQLKDASSSLSQAGSTLASCATEQAASIEETSASLEELTGMVSINLESAKLSTDLFQRVKQHSADGANAMKNLTMSMGEIRKTNDKVQNLVKVISDIAEKTKVIDEIVFQTKLLSFNASVEAERAGEHGRGFAVVAQEVGSLAEMSGKAAQEISSIVSSSIHEVSTITRDNKDKVEAGDKFVSETSIILDKIVELSVQATKSSDEILKASEEQAKGIQQINEAVVQLDQVTQENVSMSDKAAYESTVVSEQSQKLNDVVLRLKELVTGIKISAESFHNNLPLHGPNKSEKIVHSAKKETVSSNNDDWSSI